MWILAAYRRTRGQVGWIGEKVDGRQALLYVHQMNLEPDYKKILRLSYDVNVIITYDNRKSNLR